MLAGSRRTTCPQPAQPARWRRCRHPAIRDKSFGDGARRYGARSRCFVTPGRPEMTYSRGVAGVGPLTPCESSSTSSGWPPTLARPSATYATAVLDHPPTWPSCAGCAVPALRAAAQPPCPSTSSRTGRVGAGDPAFAAVDCVHLAIDPGVLWPQAPLPLPARRRHAGSDRSASPCLSAGFGRPLPRPLLTLSRLCRGRA